MKFKILISMLFLLTAFVLAPSLARAQEGEPVVVDEVIAQVNDGVVTLSQLKREMKERIETLKQNGRTEQQATSEVESHKAELIALLINEQLLIQKGKELDLTERVEAEVNKRMLDVAKENGITSIDKLDDAMRQAKLDPVAIRGTMRIEIMKQAVLESEVDSKLFFSYSQDELHKYFDAHQGNFLKPETVELSEIFLGLAGKQEADVKALAAKLVAQARSGADFCTLAAAYTEIPATAGKKPCKVGLFQVPDLSTAIAGAIKNLKAGAVSEPLKTDEGYHILRVDARTAGSNAPTFNENNVREAITRERSAKAREDYLQGLRNDGYVKIAESYRAEVEPLLKIVPPAAVTKKAPEKKKGKILGIIPKP
ncbi:MAG: peptidyl-prolyl cis-trans isomerase SurA [Blastocatellia bacterium]|nr:peptidyl-prolyl cis-trans isomerase SurA [Blastocatellia bacterium]